MTDATQVGTSATEGFPGDMRFRPVSGKNPGARGKLWVGDSWKDDDGSKWNSEPWKWQTAEQIAVTMADPDNQKSYTGIGLMTGSKVGGYCWIDFDGEEMGADGEYTKHAVGDFMHVFGRPKFDLPPAPTNISGREGRSRMLFRVPPNWQKVLYGKSIPSAGPTGAIEWLYEKEHGKCFHAVIEGQHPGGNGWFYRWEEGKSPNDIPVPDLPEWMISAILTWPFRKAAESNSGGGVDYDEEKPGPIDVLTPGQTKKLLKGMQKFFPYRGAPAGKFGGHYDILRRLTLSLWRGIGDQKLFEMWLQDWDDISDWSDLNGGTMVSFAQSLAKSDTGDDKVKPWAAAWAIATENGWKAPSWAMPPREINADTLTVDVTKKLEELKKGLKLIDDMDTPTQRGLATQSLRDQIGMKEREFMTILQLLQEELSETCEGGFFDEVCDGAQPIEEAIERFLPFGAVTMLGADPGTGKSVFIYRVAEAAAYGKKFMGQLQCVEGNVLVVQKDESDANMRQKRDLMGMQDPKRRIRVQMKFSGGHFPELVEWIKEHKARYVVMDSFASLFAGGADLTESDAGLYLYRLNAIAAEYNVAILLTHHLKKAPMSGDRQNVSLSDFYGSTFISAGTSDAWGLYRDPETEGEDKPFILKNVKPRSGIAQMGDKFLVHGNVEDLSLTMGAVNGMTDGLPKLKENEQKALSELKKATSPEKAMPVGDIGKAGTICGGSGLTKKQAQRAMQRLGKLPTIQRVRLATGARGVQPVAYWWKGA